MEKYSFFNSVNGDRRYDADDWAEWFESFFTDGVFNNGLKVKPGIGMKIIIEAGSAFCKGYKYKNDSDLVKDVAISDGSQSRIDNVVLRVDKVNRTFLIQIVKGQYSSSPEAPNLVRTTNIYDLRLAKINVSAGATEITSDMIEDCRFDFQDCGNVIQTVQTPDLTEVFNNCYQEVKNAVAKIKNYLSEEELSKLAMKFQEVEDKVETSSQQNILWEGQNTMPENETIILKQKISEQKNGIVFIWGPKTYEYNDTPDEFDLNTFFVPKKIVELYPLNSINMIMSTYCFTDCATKTLVIYDDKIVGTSQNEYDQSSFTGAKDFDNKKFELRYVIGV